MRNHVFVLVLLELAAVRNASAQSAPLAESPSAPPNPQQPAPAAPSDFSEIEAALARDAKSDASAASPAPAASTSAAPSAPRSASGVQSLNPDVSVIADFAAASFSHAQNHQTGGHDPTERGFNLQQLELSFSGAVDPYFRFDSHLVFGPDGFELEEAYGTTLDLPAHLQVRAGQFLTRFGRMNATHPHTWDFVDQPFALGRVFGGDGNRGLGTEVSILTPLPWFAELVGSVTRADGEGTNRSFFGGENPGVHDVRDFLYVAALKQFFALSDDWSLFWGLSAARGPNASGGNRGSELYGTDVYVKYRPVSRQSTTQVTLQSEWIYRKRHLDGFELWDVGGYAQLVYRFAQRWSAGARYEYGSAARNQAGSIDVDPLDPEWVNARDRESLALTFYPTEFSRLRLQGSRDAGIGRDVWAGFLAVEFAIGAHGAHAF